MTTYSILIYCFGVSLLLFFIFSSIKYRKYFSFIPLVILFIEGVLLTVFDVDYSKTSFSENKILSIILFLFIFPLMEEIARFYTFKSSNVEENINKVIGFGYSIGIVEILISKFSLTFPFLFIFFLDASTGADLIKDILLFGISTILIGFYHLSLSKLYAINLKKETILIFCLLLHFGANACGFLIANGLLKLEFLIAYLFFTIILMNFKKFNFK